MTNNTWYTILTAGGAYNPTPARGPFSSVEAAEAAIDRFYERHGANAGSYLAATSAKIAGPFLTRAEAKAADISTCRRIVRGVA